MVNKKKCTFGDVQQWPVLKRCQRTQGTFGSHIYQRFVRDHGKITKTLTELLKDRFIWSEAVQQAFETLRSPMTTFPVLAIPDFTKTFVVETDASS